MSSRNYNRKDHLYKKAKDEGLLSRAAYKLTELNNRFGFLKPGSRILDLGCWPGGWLQIAGRAVGASGHVIGIDLQKVEEAIAGNIITLEGDVSDPEVLNKAIALAGGKFDLVLSDMSPKLSGIKELDHAACEEVANLAIGSAEMALRPGGSFVCKMFKSNEAEQFYRATRTRFAKLNRVELDATRKTSNEFYIVGLGFKGGAPE